MSKKEANYELGFGSRVKIWVYCPRDAVTELRRAIGNAGGGQIGNYTHCCFVTEGTGYFLPQDGARPAVGSVGKPEEVPESRIEFECHADLVVDVIDAINHVHPYEEVPIDIFPLLELQSVESD